ncbi:hypothetical protein DICSQDRAFT_46830 [Dichomitus squalens LYAD-421 SS1]|uniref:uncharacterized protein n=1 Tax=Dichomitus squalens (strain LYAD-421) TaxID=732165 RepID=UPI0004412D6F|nr:uncharacterized protein DICSQDRAFT_46830 [Dichomitus squalens LYAD-421 SS1]EJF66632.1 hypothetical protein DICSQDRAFT_46830 [Dichomitus squalens LYAD-421 SS1]
MVSSESATREVHPVFAAAFPDGDVTLLSNDDVLFPISSSTLSRASPWFRTMLGLPQNSPETSGVESVIPVSESSEVLLGLLSMISSISLPTLDNVDSIEPLLHAAEKYEMTMPIAIIRIALRTLVDKSPIRVYDMACRMSWEEEAKAAASCTLRMDILSENTATELARLEGPHLMKLLMLHERRRKLVAAALADSDLFNAGNKPGRRCCDELEDHTDWWALKVAWLTKPWNFVCLGREGDETTAVPSEVELMLEGKCPKCSRNFYQKTCTLENLRGVARSLPQTIEV